MNRAGRAAIVMGSYRERIQRPVFIVSTPRSGSTLLFETLKLAPELFTIGGESHRVIENIPELSPANRGWTSNRLTREDAVPEVAEHLSRSFYSLLADRNGRCADAGARMLEKTPKNALRVPFFARIWPDATFVYLYRDVRETLASMMEAWSSTHFRTYPGLPGWTGRHPWSLLLVPGWRDLSSLPLPQIVAHQWAITTDLLLDDLEKIPKDRLRGVTYSDLLARPQQTLLALTASLDLSWDQSLGPKLPLSKTTLSRPARDKWRRLEGVIEAVVPIVEAADARARSFLEHLARC